MMWHGYESAKGELTIRAFGFNDAHGVIIVKMWAGGVVVVA